jgi:competence protein ComEA
MFHEMRSARVYALALLAALGVALAASPVLAGDGPARLEGVVNVNTATVEELQLLPGIGEARATAVVEARKRRGGFKAVDELLEVKGIGESSLARMRPFVSIKGKTTAQIK